MKKIAWKALITVAIIAVIPALPSKRSTFQSYHLISQARPNAQLIYTLNAHKDRVPALAISPDGINITNQMNDILDNIYLLRVATFNKNYLFS